jgi:hypothetical protein
MSGTTSPLAFPYPTDTDFVTNGDEAIQSLAEALDDYLAGADSALTAGASMTLGATNRAYRRGGMVYMLVDDWTTTGSISSGATIATLPAGYRPSVALRGTCSNFTDSTPVALILNTNGTVVTSNAIGSGKILKGGVTFPI